MKIQIRSNGFPITIPLPTNLVFSRSALRLANRLGRKYAGQELDALPPGALDALFAEIRRIKRQYGRWELVEIESADGDIVKISL